MISLLAKSLHGRPIRTYLAVAGIATSTLLVLILAAAFRSVRGAMRSYAGQQAVDLWVAPPGSDNLIRGSFAAYLGVELVDSIRVIEGIARADPLMKGFVPVRPLDSMDVSRTATLLVIGYSTPDGLGGPPEIVLGSAPRGGDEVLLDRAAAFRLGVGVGDSVRVGPLTVLVSGLTGRTNILATQFMFAEFAAAATTLGASARASLIPVQLEEHADPNVVLQRLLARFPDLFVYTRAAFVEANEREVIAGFTPLLALVTALGIGAACVLVGLLVLSVVDERRAEIAVLLALGARARAIGQGVLLFAGRLLVLGIFIGSLCAYALAAVLDSVLPTIPLALTLTDSAWVAAVFGATGVVMALVPIAHLRRIDPLDAFRP